MCIRDRDNPITALAKFMNCEKSTASSRVMEARARGLLTKPKAGTFGGKLTAKCKEVIRELLKNEGVNNDKENK